jgi:hypothetical protein
MDQNNDPAQKIAMQFVLSDVMTYNLANRWHYNNKSKVRQTHQHLLKVIDGFDGLVVSMLASGTQGRGIKPGRSRWIFTNVKKKSSACLPPEGSVKESVPCPSFAACKRS